MKISEFTCPACGAAISLDESIEAVVCKYCGTSHIVILEKKGEMI